jgi:prepilin-type N-terminal cleavage/methylation domain-containing protein
VKHAAQQGFTLLELIMVIVIASVASVPILGRFTQAGSSMLLDEQIQTAVQLAQERAEGVLADRRTQGYAAVPTGTTVDVPGGSYAAYTRTLSITEPPAGSGCAAGATCKEVIVSVDRGASRLAEVTFLLVSY